ncbi:MAG: TonB-dependent receptor, partial [Flavobacteriales bacterium]|nr:TonB-dependent receptor [Flavobacteriales bacterium]
INSFTQEPSEVRVETGNNNSKIAKFNLEYSKDFSSKFSTQIGYGNYWKHLDNNYTVAGSNPSNETYSQTNTRHKFYGYASYTFNKKLSAKIGIAGETSNFVDDNQDNSYFIFQPLLDLKYKLSKNLSFKLKYRSRSDYPSVSETNPFEKVINPRTVSIGNPNLTPSVTHKISLRTSILQGLISIEPYYHVSNNYIGQTGRLRTDGIFEFTFNNVGFYQEKGIETNFTIPFSKKWIWQNSITFYNSSIENNGETNIVKDWLADSNLIFTGIKNDGVIVLNYHRSMGKEITSLGYDRNENDYWLLLYQQPFLKKKLSVMVGYFLPIDWGANFVQDKYTTANGYEQISNTDVSLLKNMLIIKATYRFSKGKIKKTDKDIELEDEGGSGGLL